MKPENVIAPSVVGFILFIFINTILSGLLIELPKSIESNSVLLRFLVIATIPLFGAVNSIVCFPASCIFRFAPFRIPLFLKYATIGIITTLGSAILDEGVVRRHRDTMSSLFPGKIIQHHLPELGMITFPLLFAWWFFDMKLTDRGQRRSTSSSQQKSLAQHETSD